tara:strand:- start:3439 stop:4212 length:774 start_codon:yes stop_codon:yes gene_type:complete
VYEWNGTAWNQLGADLDGEVAGDESGNPLIINADGDRIVIGAPLNPGNGFLAGHVRIYEWNGTAWNQQGADIDGEAAYDNSGFSVSMDNFGSRIAIGAPENDGGGNNAGHVRVYDWNGTAWIKLGADANGEAASDQSGYSVSIDSVGDRLAIAARNNSGNGRDAGHVRVYQYNLPTNIDEVENENHFSIYPNPVSQNLILETQNTMGEIAQITSITGALLLEFSITKEKEKIDVSGFQNGIYFLKVGEVTKKIIVAR